MGGQLQFAVHADHAGAADGDGAGVRMAAHVHITVATGFATLAGAVVQPVAVAIGTGTEPGHDRCVGAAGDRVFRDAVGRTEGAHGHRRVAGVFTSEYADADRIAPDAAGGDGRQSGASARTTEPSCRLHTIQCGPLSMPVTWSCASSTFSAAASRARSASAISCRRAGGACTWMIRLGPCPTTCTGSKPAPHSWVRFALSASTSPYIGSIYRAVIPSNDQ